MQTTIAVFAFLQERLTDQLGLCPTFREVAGHVGLAHPSSISRHVDKLEAWGLLCREPGVSRSIRLTAKGRATTVQDLLERLDDLTTVRQPKPKQLQDS